MKHYWFRAGSEGAEKGYRHDKIASAIKRDRFKAVQSNLSFMKRDDDKYAGDKLRKMREIDTLIGLRARAAWVMERIYVIDEARVKLHSAFCPFLWVMFCKPISVGCTVYVGAFAVSKYVWRWKWWDGKSKKTKGQPIDQDNLDEDGEEVGTVRRLMDLLVGPEFDDTGVCVITDKAFTSISLVCAFARRYICLLGTSSSINFMLASCVLAAHSYRPPLPPPPPTTPPCTRSGMIRGARPKAMPKGADKYFPFKGYVKGEEGGYDHGWYRTAYRKIAAGAAGLGTMWLMAMVWRDSRMVTMVATTFICGVGMTVDRYDPSVKKRVARFCLRPLKMYNLWMGAVDELDRDNARANIRMNRCPKRYHRQLFYWLLSTVGYHNVRICFEHLWPNIDSLKKKYENGGWGFTTWFQDMLGCALIDHGVKVAAEQCAAGEKPYFMPKRAGRKKRPNAVAEAGPVLHAGKWGEMSRGFCSVCAAVARAAAVGQSGRVTHMPKVGRVAAKPIPRPRYGCTACDVNLCKVCHEQWDHKAKRPKARQ
jgi:hypothetical protein